VNGNVFKQNRPVIVPPSLEKSFSSDMQHFVITDLLHAGFAMEDRTTGKFPAGTGSKTLPIRY
jgi:hypothetical protein